MITIYKKNYKIYINTEAKVSNSHFNDAHKEISSHNIKSVEVSFLVQKINPAESTVGNID